MEFIKRLLSKLGKSGLAEKVGEAGQKAGQKMIGEAHSAPKYSREQVRSLLKGTNAVTAAGGAGVGSAATYAGMKDGEDEEEEGLEELLQKGKNKARKWMD